MDRFGVKVWRALIRVGWMSMERLDHKKVGHG
jgi:hypothetical protein